jgi:hypothetical protein
MSNDKPLLFERLRQRVYANVPLTFPPGTVLVASPIFPVSAPLPTPLESATFLQCLLDKKRLLIENWVRG